MPKVAKWIIDKRDAVIILDAIYYAIFSWHQYCHNFPGLPTVVRTMNLDQILALVDLYEKYIRRWMHRPPAIMESRLEEFSQMRKHITRSDIRVFADPWDVIIHRPKGRKGG